MIEVIIAVGLLILVIVGLWWTRGSAGGGIPGGLDDL